MTGLCGTCARIAGTLPDGAAPHPLPCGACGAPCSTVGSHEACLAALQEYARRCLATVQAAKGKIKQPPPPPGHPSGIVVPQLRERGPMNVTTENKGR